MQFFVGFGQVQESLLINDFSVMFSKGVLGLVIGILCCLPTASWGAEVSPPQVYSQVAVFKQDLELIRLELGMPAFDSKLAIVRNAAPYEVYYQAVTLCLKAAQLRYEWTRSLGTCPVVKAGVLTPADVIEQVKAALGHMQVVKLYFNIETLPDIPVFDPTKTPTDVFQAISAGNRQLNILVQHKNAPGDVFRKVTLAVYYAADLLAQFPEIEQRIPVPPPLVRKKTPSEVFSRLVEGYTLVHRINTISGYDSLELEVNDLVLAKVRPNDVYDIASLLVAELARLYGFAGGKEAIQAYQPPPKIPAQVFQRSGILLQQLQILLEQVKRHPDWLKRGG